MQHDLQLNLHSTTLATRASTSPGHDRSIVSYGSKSIIIGLDLLHILPLMLHSTTVTPVTSTAPGDTGPSNRLAAKGRALACILQLTLHSRAVTTILSIAPGHDGSVAKNGSERTAKSSEGGLDLLPFSN